MSKIGSNNNQKIGFSKPFTAGTFYYTEAPKAMLPTDALTPLDDSFINLGRLSEDGFTEPSALDEPDNVYADGKVPVDSSDSEYKPKFSGKLLQYSDFIVNKAIFGAANVSGSEDNFMIKKNSSNSSKGAFVIQRKIGKSQISRIVVPSAKLTRTGDISHNASDLLGLEWTLSPDVNAAGDSHYEYITDIANIAFAVKSSAGTNGAIAPSGESAVQATNSVTFLATPDSGYAVDVWKVDGKAVDGATGNTFTLDNVTAKQEVSVSFKKVA